jgi:hypothetical protein
LLCQHLATPLEDAVEGDEGGLVLLRHKVRRMFLLNLSAQ